MRKIIYLVLSLISFSQALRANVGDTTWVQAQNVQLSWYNNYDSTAVFPDGSKTYRKIYMIMTLGQYNCAPGTQYCHQWDYDLENYIMTKGGDTLEISRFITPYATSGTPGFGPSWKQHYIFDVSDYAAQLRDTALVRVHYSGYSGGFTLDVKFAFIEGTPERNVLKIDKLWSGGFTYGNPSNLIDSNIKPITLTMPVAAQSAEMKVAITGHGQDNATGCCEFDFSGVGHTYAVAVNSAIIGQQNMNVVCGTNEVYPQGGTWAFARAGNWCPGGKVTVGRYKLAGATPGAPYNVDLNFDDSYDGTGSYGSYTLEGSVVSYGAANHTLDASVEEIMSPSSFEWYKRENPLASKPVVTVRNAGSTTITSIFFQYGVKDSDQSQFIWTGNIPAFSNVTITMPALQAITNLSLNGVTGSQQFMARILQVNGIQDNDSSNDVLTSTFNIAPTWPSQFAINLTTSCLAVNAQPILSDWGSGASDASWDIIDANGAVVASHSNLSISTTYKDTVNLTGEGFYALRVSTVACSGLHWWPLDGQSGYRAGSLVVRDFNNGVNLPLNGNVYSGTYHDDFGCGFTQYFTTSGVCQMDVPVISRNGNTLTATGGGTYQWYRNGVLINGATNSTYVISSNGNYTVKVTDGGDCSNNSANYAVINVGVTEVTDLSLVSIAPNPAQNEFAIRADNELIGAAYMLTDMTGRAVAHGQLTSDDTRVSIAELSAGIYLLNIGSQSSHAFKVVKN